jgi:hypothetical protein
MIRRLEAAPDAPALCGCCGRFAEWGEWCARCTQHLAPLEIAGAPWDRTWFAQRGEPCPLVLWRE